MTGITPAYAGKTCVPISLQRDHPHVCGKDLLYKNDGLGSPRMRERLSACGKDPTYISDHPLCGKTFFPTFEDHLGMRENVSIKDCGNRDHPRVCGKTYSFCSCSAGITPRMRERLQHRKPSKGSPAYAERLL